MKLIPTLPHVSRYERRWVRRTMLLALVPVELVLSTLRIQADILKGAWFWWWK